MPYTIPFSDPTKTPITVNDLTVNTSSTSLTLVGRNYPNYGQAVAGDLIHLLENFAYNQSPANPVEGQLWFNNSTKRLLLNDSTGGTANWRPAGGTHIGTTIPTNALAGDLWVDLSSQQLKLYNGSSFVVVGPNNITGSKTGSFVELITDVTGANHYVNVEYVNDDVISISSTETFIPQQSIIGFTVIQPGVNITSKLYAAAGNTTAITPAKFYGPSSSADAINVTSPSKATVSGNSIARRDVTNTFTSQQIVQNDGGVILGQNQNFSVSVSQGSGVLTNLTDGGLIDIKTSNNQVQTTMVRVDGLNQRVGINNLLPLATLDIGGTGKFSGAVSVTSSTTSTSPTTGALVISGGLGVAKKAYIGGDLNVSGITTLGPLDPYGATLSGAAMLPAVDNVYDLGSPTNKFKTIYATTFSGTFSGTFAGNVTGTVTGAAGSLQLSSVFRLGGGTTTLNISNVSTTSPVTVTTSTAHNLIDGAYVSISGVSGTVQLNGQAYYAKVLSTTVVSLYSDSSLSVPIAGTTFTTYASGGTLTVGSVTNDPSEMTSSGISFKGSGETISLLPTLTSKAITNRTEVSDNQNSDYLLIYRTNSGLKKVTRSNFLAGESFVPIGSVFPYAGATPPLGYLLCDGSLVSRANYPNLYTVIGVTYGAGADPTLFRLPDMRGRFPLGNYSMQNSNTTKTITAVLAADALNTRQIYLKDGSQIIQGMTVTGLNIAPNTTVDGVSGNQVSLSNTISATNGTGLTFTFTVAGAPALDPLNYSRVVPEGTNTAPATLGGTGGNSHTTVDLSGVSQGSKTLGTGSQTIGTSFSAITTNPYQTLNYIIRADVPTTTA
jgi:microcystin-dependent protein